ncbi:MAG: GTP cyclohydrolase II, partial [Gammaproteobacteria bacterium]
MTLRFVESSKLPTRWGVFDIHGFEDTVSDKEHV